MPALRLRTLIAAATLAAFVGAALVALPTLAAGSPVADEAKKKKKKKKKKPMRVSATCENTHTPPEVFPSRDEARARLRAERREARRRRASGSAITYKPLAGVTITGTLTDLTPQDGDNAIGKTDSAKTDGKGDATLEFEFNNFGNYRIDWTASKRGYKTQKGSVSFGVQNRDTGACEPVT